MNLLGLDLSLTASAAVLLPSDWRPGDWNLRTLVVGQKTPKGGADWAFQMGRLDLIADRIVSFSRRWGANMVFVEDYAYSASQTAGRAVAELGGLVKWRLWKERIEARPVVMGSARKTLLGHVPSKKTSGVAVKDYVNEKLARMGAKFATLDEGDAFIVANHGRALLGLPHVGVGE